MVGVRTSLQTMWMEVAAKLEEMQQTLTDAGDLQARYLAARLYTPGEEQAVLLSDPDWITARQAAMSRGASAEIMAFVSNSSLRGPSPAPLPPSEAQQNRGTVVRTVFPASSFPELSDAAAVLTAAGEAVRVAPDLRIKMTVVDRQEALVGIDETGLRAALYVREPAFVSTLCMLFELVWERAIPYEGESEGLTQREREVLLLLATGDKDETIAKKLNIGVRTVRRHISSAMQKLGTDSRFAAGVQTVKRGWL